jgi:hypothetical protein
MVVGHVPNIIITRYISKLIVSLDLPTKDSW